MDYYEKSTDIAVLLRPGPCHDGENDGSERTHKVVGLAWFGGVFLSALAAMTILYANESFHIQDVDRAEPSEWELGSRYLEWILFPVLALPTFIMGLR